MLFKKTAHNSIMNLVFPPPHYVLFEPLDDHSTLVEWTRYKKAHPECEYEMIDAAHISSVESFTPAFEEWMTRKSSHRTRILLVLHSEFLTFSCQQVLRRYLEQRSFKCRVWFHVEDPTQVQPAILSRCITKRIQTHIHRPSIRTL